MYWMSSLITWDKKLYIFLCLNNESFNPGCIVLFINREKTSKEVILKLVIPFKISTYFEIKMPFETYLILDKNLWKYCASFMTFQKFWTNDTYDKSNITIFLNIVYWEMGILTMSDYRTLPLTMYNLNLSFKKPKIPYNIHLLYVCRLGRLIELGLPDL